MIATFTRSAPERIDRQTRHERRVDPAGEPEHDRAEAVLLDVVVQPEPQRLVDLLLARGDRRTCGSGGCEGDSAAARGSRLVLCRKRKCRPPRARRGHRRWRGPQLANDDPATEHPDRTQAGPRRTVLHGQSSRRLGRGRTSARRRRARPGRRPSRRTPRKRRSRLRARRTVARAQGPCRRGRGRRRC